ncbi:MAG: hypothetical protein ACX930_00130 [Erythrobacter sp.]
MTNLDPSFSISVDHGRREVHFTASGLWDMDVLADFSRELLTKGKPLFAGGPMRVYGDLTGFVTQTREVADGIRVVMQESAKLGMDRTAILADSTLAAMQYKRLNEGVSTEIFRERDEALTWLRAA